MTKLLYIANLRLPTEKAYGIQIAKMCEVFATLKFKVESEKLKVGDNFKVELIYPHRKNHIQDNFFSYYSVKNSFKLKEIWAPDFYFPGKLDKISVTIKNLISGFLLACYALSSDADIIYSRDEWPSYFLSFFSKKIVFEAHNFSEARTFFYRRFLKNNIKVVAISESLRFKFLNIGFSANNVLVAHDSVDLSEFDIQISKEEARRKLNLPQGVKIVMYTGHLFEWKGVNVLLEAARNFQFPISNFQRREDILFIFVGGMDYDVEQFKERAKDMKNVLILGHKPHQEIPSYLKAADVLALPNSAKDKIYLNTSPVKLFEYMASGCPIVASNLPSIAEVLNYQNSVLVNPDDAGDLARGIEKILNEPNLGQQLSKRALEDVKNYTWEHRAKKILLFI